MRVKSLFTGSLIGFIAVLTIFVVWMNATPGYFQGPPCGCGAIDYAQEFGDVVIIDGETFISPPLCPLVVCPSPLRSFFGSLVVIPLSLVDFNK